MSSMMQRRQSLGVVSGSSLNARSSMGRPSLGGSLKPSVRQSMGAAAEQLPRRSSTMSRKSSAVGVRGAADPRPLGDKQFMSEALCTICDYLINNGYDHKLDMAGNKNWKPTGKEFQTIVCFLIKKLDPNWQLGAKFEDEFIVTMKTIGYPYGISKTALSAVGSPHAWPQLLGVLKWVVDLLIYDAEAAACGGQNTGEFETGSDITREGDRMFIDYLKNSYRCFLAGDDLGHDEHKSQLIEFVERQTNEVSEVLSVKEQEQTRLQDGIQAELQHGKELPKLQETLNKHKNDFQALSDYIEKLKAHNKKLNEKLDSRKEEVASEQAKIDVVRETCKSLKSKINAQELSADEALRMVTERDRIEQKLKDTTAFAQSMKHKEWEADSNLKQQFEELQAAVRAYTTKVTEMQLLPPGSSNAQGVDFRIEINKETVNTATSDKDVLCTDVLNKIVPALSKYKQLISNQATSLRNSTIMLQDQEEQSQEALEESSSRYESIQAKHAKLEDKFNRLKEQFDVILEDKAKEYEEIENSMELLRDDPLERERRRTQASIKTVELNNALEVQRDARDKESDALQRKIIDAVGVLHSFNLDVTRELAEMKEYYHQRVEAIKELPSILN